MILAVSKNQLGTDRDLIYDGETWSWSSLSAVHSEDNLFTYGYEGLDVSQALGAMKVDYPKIRETPWFKSLSEIYVEDFDKIRWSDVIPSWGWKKYVKDLVECIWSNITDESNSYYVNNFKRNLELTQALRSPKIDVSTMNALASEANIGQKSAVLSFSPGDDGFAKKTKYSLSSSVTGRMTVTSGPNILTLSKKFRKILKSRWGSNGALLEIDVQSMEPRVALSLFGKSVDGDVYEDVMKGVDSEISRDAAKIATLAALYGASHHGIKSHLPGDIDAVKVLQDVKAYFGVRHLEKILEDQHRDLGYIRNTHGRKIFSEVPSVNHMIQSSAVDVAFDIFDLLIAGFKEKNIKFCPVYFIHDAIIVDVERTFLKDVVELTSQGFFVETVKQTFPVKIKEIS